MKKLAIAICLLGLFGTAEAVEPEEAKDKQESAKAAVDDGAAAAAAAAKTPVTPNKSYPGWDGNLAGDSMRFMANIYGLDVFGTSGGAKRCATAQSRARVVSDDGKTLTLRFTYVAAKGNEPTFGDTESSYASCAAGNRVSEGIQYTSDRTTLLQYDHRLTGLSFGGLVVPFKFYLAGDKRLAASTTLGPYLGVRMPFFYGTTITPLFSAGLGLVPVRTSGSDGAETRSALSTALGLVLTSSKKESFNSGIIFGRDFLGKNGRGDDDTVNKGWFSIYVGYSP